MKRPSRKRNRPISEVWTQDKVADLCPRCGAGLHCRPFWPYPLCIFCGWFMAGPEGGEPPGDAWRGHGARRAAALGR